MKQRHKGQAPVELLNPINGERWLCDNLRAVHSIAGIEYLAVRRAGQARQHLMRKESLRRAR